MMKAVAAQEVGPEGFCLLTAIAMTEDAKRYRGPVVFFNQPLVAVCGFSSEKVLFRVRTKCVETGWLAYFPGKKGVAARYWVLIPEQCDGIQDGPVDEVTENSGEACESIAEQSGVNRAFGGNQLGVNRESIGRTFIPVPNPLPSPEPEEESGSAAPPPKAVEYPPEFEEVWQAFRPTHRGGKEKAEGFSEWKRAMRVLSHREAIGDAHAWLLNRIHAYAKSAEGAGEFSPAFPRWLKKGRYDDDPTKWGGSQRAGPATNGKRSAGEDNQASANQALEALRELRRRSSLAGNGGRSEGVEASGSLRLTFDSDGCSGDG
jgi:hypothetical protein